ncbi:enoyl-CoA hydratase/isomerase family protein [Streptomyces tsukubensis]|uniref:Enoyl-CoA hydratase n=1 Tax=Streptomyces tsukubensis TaxID=83656 RepID=A0A1V3ZZW2_9ACTN|nr:enoyl-CoA hydratase/isomerase family protein [Streptomyces tsukubensis]OON71932.1 enoyl-CoA hydratase [Streptomyces tsukubensis]QFR96879.1 enoyl-CoA hydratase/isomerase family protein [Streptomyces tsukubensis]
MTRTAHADVLVTRHPLTLEAHAGAYVGEVALNRPAKLNAWTAEVRAELVAALGAFNDDELCRAVVLTGSGRAFCAGQDLSETAAIAPGDHSAAEEWIDDFGRLYRAVRGLDKPTVAAVNGVAAGSGFQYALLADLRIGHGNIRMGQPEVLSGIPSITGIWAMWEILGKAKTTEFALTGRLVDGVEAHRLGLLTRLVEVGDSDAEESGEAVRVEARAEAARLAALPPGAVALTKGRIRELDEAALDQSISAAKDVHVAAYATGEPQREMAAFLAGRRR